MRRPDQASYVLRRRMGNRRINVDQTLRVNAFSVKSHQGTRRSGRYVDDLGALGL